MNIEEFNSISDSALLKKMYVAQLRTQMDVKQILDNIIQIRKKVDPEAFENMEKGNNPYHWEHLSEISNEMDAMYDSFIHQLRQDGDTIEEMNPFKLKKRED